jgi:hypothetical protein
MFTKLNSVTALKTLIKLAAVTLTSPATVAVASSLYPDHPITKVTVSIATLLLVEGCLLLGWEMLTCPPRTDPVAMLGSVQQGGSQNVTQTVLPRRNHP